MDTSHLQSTRGILINYLRDHGYHDSYIKTLSHEIDLLIRSPEFHAASSYEEYFQSFISSKYTNRETQKTKRQILGRIRAFDENGKLPSKKSQMSLFSDDVFATLSDSYKNFINTCTEIWKMRSLASSTIKSRRTMILKFCNHLCQNNVTSFCCVTEDIILSYFYNKEDIIRGYDTVKFLRMAINDYSNVNPEDNYCKSILSFLPQIPKRHKIYPYLTDEEVKKIEALLINPPKGISKRDIAIFTLSFYSGIRRGDLSNLKMADIDWDRDTISFTQSKTGREVTLPLIAIVGNRILDYIENERPRYRFEYLFVSTNHSPDKLSGGSIYDIIEKGFLLADVRANGGRKGTHLLRHRLAMSLLKAGTTSPVITNILGQSNPQSVNAYMESDESALKRCALSVDKYPIREEVFDL